MPFVAACYRVSCRVRGNRPFSNLEIHPRGIGSPRFESEYKHFLIIAYQRGGGYNKSLQIFARLSKLALLTTVTELMAMEISAITGCIRPRIARE